MKYRSIAEAVGKTPLIELRNIKRQFAFEGAVFAKLESMNPAGSIKDRAAKEMLSDAEECGKISSGATLIEPTSGNTGIGLAALAAAKGYKMILVMPDTMSMERRRILAAYGAEIVLTDGKLGMKGAIDEAERLHGEIGNSIVFGQFSNPANPRAHYKTTGPEIWEDMQGKVDIFVAGVGTGGTVSGVGRYLKERKKDVKIIAVEPASSPVLSGGQSGPHKIQGIGAGFVPENLDFSLIDEVITVDNEEAYDFTRMLARKEGILAGISSGAALAAAVNIALRKENIGANIATVFPDTGDRYLSCGVF